MNLIICCTPLQILIAEKIIELHPNERFHGLVITPILSNKYQYYFDKLSKICQKIDLIVTNNYSKFLIYFNVIKVKFLFHNSFEKIFIANINDSIIQAIVSKFSKSLLYTFDDGTINISNRKFDNFACESSFKKVIRFFFNIHENVDSIKYRSKLHYTIYPNFPNIVPYVKVIELIKDNFTYNYSYKGEIKVMLGQSIFMDDNKNKKIIEKIIYDNSIDFYFPHPLERFHIDNVNYINTFLIFEDYLIKYWFNQKCTIYTFFSSAALNISQLNNVNVISFKPLSLNNIAWLEVYDLFKKSNIKIVDCDI